MSNTHGGQMELDDGALTLGDLEDVETALGYPMAEAAERPGGQWRMACALIWVRRRKLDATFTFEDARALPMEAMVDMVEDMEALTADLTDGGELRPPQAPSMTG